RTLNLGGTNSLTAIRLSLKKVWPYLNDYGSQKFRIAALLILQSSISSFRRLFAPRPAQQNFLQKLSGIGSGFADDRFRRPLRDNGSAAVSPLRSHVDHPVRRFHH